MTVADLITRVAEWRAELARLRATVDAVALLDEFAAMLEQLDGTETAAGRDLNTREAAVQLGVGSHRTVERWCRETRFPHAYRTSGATGDWRIPAGDLEGFRRARGGIRRDGDASAAAAEGRPAAPRAWPPAGRGSPR